MEAAAEGDAAAHQDHLPQAALLVEGGQYLLDVVQEEAGLAAVEGSGAGSLRQRLVVASPAGGGQLSWKLDMVNYINHFLI